MDEAIDIAAPALAPLMVDLIPVPGIAGRIGIVAHDASVEPHDMPAGALSAPRPLVDVFSTTPGTIGTMSLMEKGNGRSVKEAYSKGRFVDAYGYDLPSGSPFSLQEMNNWPGRRYNEVLDKHGTVFIDCHGIRGAAGQTAAMLLVERGSTADEALDRISNHRSAHAGMTLEQIQFVRGYAGRLLPSHEFPGRMVVPHHNAFYDFVSAIKAGRKAAGISIEALEDRLGISELYYLFNDDAGASFGEAAHILHELGYDLTITKRS